jgi:hypothetical protein
MNTDYQTIFGNTPSKSNSYKVITINGHASLSKTKALKEYENKFYIIVAEKYVVPRTNYRLNNGSSVLRER